MRRVLELLLSRKATKLERLLVAVIVTALIIPTTLVSFAVAQSPQSDRERYPAAFSSEYPPIERPAYLEELLSDLPSFGRPGQPFPPNEFSDLSNNFRAYAFAPNCYLPQSRRLFFYALMRQDRPPLKGDSPPYAASFPELYEFLSECGNLEIFGGGHANKHLWIVIYNIPIGITPNVTSNPIRYRKGDQNLLIIPMRAIREIDFPALARNAAATEFNKPWEN